MYTTNHQRVYLTTLLICSTQVINGLFIIYRFQGLKIPGLFPIFYILVQVYIYENSGFMFSGLCFAQCLMSAGRPVARAGATGANAPPHRSKRSKIFTPTGPNTQTLTKEQAVPGLAKSQSIWVLTGPVVNTGFNRSILVNTGQYPKHFPVPPLPLNFFLYFTNKYNIL
jgi:hypothetical protein